MRSYIVFIAVCCVFVAGQTTVRAQSNVRFFWENQKVFKTLPIRTISNWDVQVDNDGYIWFASHGNGLLRYNGLGIEIVSTSDTNLYKGATNNYFHKIAKAPDGTLWAVSEIKNSICALNPHKGTITNYKIKNKKFDNGIYGRLHFFRTPDTVLFTSAFGTYCIKNPSSYMFSEVDDTLLTTLNPTAQHPNKSKMFLVGLNKSRELVYYKDFKFLKKTPFLIDIDSSAFFTKICWVNDSLCLVWGRASKHLINIRNRRFLALFNPHRPKKTLKIITSSNPKSVINRVPKKREVMINDSTVWLLSKAKSILSINTHTLEHTKVGLGTDQQRRLPDSDLTGAALDSFGNI